MLKWSLEKNTTQIKKVDELIKFLKTKIYPVPNYIIYGELLNRSYLIQEKMQGEPKEIKFSAMLNQLIELNKTQGKYLGA